MQTFLPLPSIPLSVQVLDSKRLGKQRVEALTILNTLFGLSNGWSKHPTIKQWKGYEDLLVVYYNACIDEWIKRGYKNTMEKLAVSKIEIPHWWGNYAYHSSHRAALLFKDYEFYSRYNWTEQPEINYIWPESDKCKLKLP